MREFLTATWEFGLPVLAASALPWLGFWLWNRRTRCRETADESLRRWTVELPEIDGRA